MKLLLVAAVFVATMTTSCSSGETVNPSPPQPLPDTSEQPDPPEEPPPPKPEQATDDKDLDAGTD